MRIEAIKFDMGSRYSTPASMIPALDKHMAKAEALIGQAAERMNGELVALRERLLGEIPMPDHAAYRAELEKAREAAQERLESGIAAASGSISEIDQLRAVTALQTKLIGGASLEQLLSELGSYRELNSLALLAEQLERADIAGEARAKAIDIATGGAAREIGQLSGCLLDLVNAEANYHAQWQKMLGQLGKGAEE